MKIDTVISLTFFLFFLYGLSIFVKGMKLNSYLKKHHPSKFKDMTENLPISKKTIFFFAEGTLPNFIYKSREDWGDEKLNKNPPPEGVVLS
jgi:hypothetical protein